jgi:hypothetical protein
MNTYHLKPEVAPYILLTNAVHTERQDVVFSLCEEGYAEILRLDGNNIGSPKYLGIATYFHQDFSPILGRVSTSKRAAAHDALLAAGLKLDGNTAAHAAAILLAVGDCPQVAGFICGNT